MKLPSCPRTLIINILRKNPDGLTLTSIAELTGLHRHTATKYVYELKGAGIINERDVGSAKLCYLKEGFSKSEEKKVVGRLNGKNDWRKSSTGQVQILTAFLLLFLIPATVIIAQNATESMNSTGEIILEQVNITADTSSIEPNQTNIEMPNTSAITEANTTSIENESNEIATENQTQIPEIQNQTAAQELNITIQENLTEENVTVSNGTVLNETNATVPEAANQTGNITLPESPNVTLPEPENQPNITLPEILQPILDVRISSPEKTLRGEQFNISAIVSNIGNSDARNVRLAWEIPSGFEIVSGGDDSDCGVVSPDSECVSNLTISSSLSTETGRSELKILVKYEE